MSKRKMKKALSVALSASMAFGTLALVPPIPTVAAVEVGSETELVDDMVVAQTVYGWATENAKENKDHSVSIKMMPAGKTKEVEYTTAIKYGSSNDMTGASQAGSNVARCTKGTFVEVCLNAEGEVIDMRRVLQSGLNFDTAKYGGDLTAIGSTVLNKGANYNDIYDGDASGSTGALTGTSGRMVAMGWLLEKDGGKRRIVVGDGNRTTDVFNETYNVADDVKVYEIQNKGNFSATKISFNGEPVESDREGGSDEDSDAPKATPSDASKATDSNASKATDSNASKATDSNASKATASNADDDDTDDEVDTEVELLDDFSEDDNDDGFAPVDQSKELEVSELNRDGYIYNTPSAKRKQVVVIFDNDYEHFDENDENIGDAKVTEIYEYEELDDKNVAGFVGKEPEIVRITSDLSTTKQGSPKPTNAPYLVAASPIEVVKDKMWTIGDIEDNCPIFRGGADDNGGNLLVQFDTGWPRDAYQYMKNIEITGNDPRDLDMLLVPHGHGDHYGSLYDEWETVVRSKDNEDNSRSPIVYESYEDTIGFDIHGFPEIGGIYTDQSVRSIITNWYPNDEWNSLGDGLSMMVTLTPGHSQGCGSAVFDVEVQDTMKDAKLTYEYDPENPNADSEGYVRTYSDYKSGDHIMFAYMGGYGINGLDSAEKAGFRRTAFVSSLRYLESVFSNLDVPYEDGRKADGVYNLAQHTNQYPYTETAEVMKEYNDNHGTDYSFLHFMREGREEIINFCEKRASAMLYSDYTKEYMKNYEANGNSSPFYTYHDIQIKTDITSTKLKGNTLEDAGPYKHEGGETEIEISDQADILVMHGYDVFLNKGVVPEGEMKSKSASTGLAKSNWDLVKGFAFAKDGYVYDPDKWYVQIAAHVHDDYDGNVYSDEGPNKGIKLVSGPVDSLRGEGWCEIIRTGAMTKEEAEKLAAALEPGKEYIVNLKKTGDIINDEDDVMKTFVAVEDETVSDRAARTVKNTVNGQAVDAETSVSEDSVRAYAEALIQAQIDAYNAANGTAVQAQIVNAEFTAPKAGNLGNKAGTNGSYRVTVKFTGANALGAVSEREVAITLVLQAKAYQPRTGSNGSSSSSSLSRGNAGASSSQSGTWNIDQNGWKLVKPDGTVVKSSWAKVTWQGQNHWYHFDENGYCQGGWFTDVDGARYYLHGAHDGQFGAMYTGWQLIDGKYYYFETVEGNGQGKLYVNTTTPDGYHVGADGQWIQ